MKNIFAYLIGVIAYLACHTSLAQEWQWVKKIGIGNPYDQCSVLSSTTDDDGNTYVMGWYIGTLTLGDKTYNGSSTSYERYFVAKFDEAGNIVWSRNITPSTSEISVHAVFADKNGNAYISGSMVVPSYYTGRVNFGDGHFLSFEGKWGNFNNSSAFICKYSPTGTIEMKKFYTGRSEENSRDFQVNKDGNLFVRGLLLDSYTKSPSTYSDSYTIRAYSPSAQLIWERSYDFRPSIYSPGTIKLLVDDEHLWVINQWEDAQQITFSGETYAISKNESFLTGWDPTTGALQMVRPAKAQLLYSVDRMLIRNGMLCVLGSFIDAYKSAITFGDTEVKSTQPDASTFGYEGYLAQFDIVDGKYEWANRMTQMNYEYSVNVSSRGNVYMGNGGMRTNAPRYITKLSPSGESLWTQQSTAYIHDHVYLGVDRNENIYAAGWASNGGRATFGSVSITYNNEVGFVSKLQNTNITLQQLSVSDGVLTPAFKPGITQYTVAVANTRSSITVTPTAKLASASIKVNDISVASGTASQLLLLQVGKNVVTIDVTDEDGSMLRYTVIVIRENATPVINPPGTLIFPEESLAEFTVEANDADVNQTLTYSLYDAPVGAVIEPASGKFTWLTTEADGPGIYMFKVRVTDNGEPAKYAETAINLEINEVNTSPILQQIATENNSVVACGDGFSFSLLAEDNDVPLQKITYSLQGVVPKGARIDPARGDFQWTPSEGQEGSHVITFRATDSGTPALYDEQVITLTVHAFESPIETSVWPETIVYNELATFSIKAVPHALGYNWAIPGGFEIVAGQNTPTIQVRALTGTREGTLHVSNVYSCGESIPLEKPIIASKARATVAISELEQLFVGEPRPAVVTTNPSNLTVDIRYDGSTLAPSKAGEYVVSAIVKDENYEGEATGVLVIHVVTGTDQVEREENIILSPNPTPGIATLAFAQKKAVDIVVVDIYGKLILQATASGVFELNLNTYAPGVYFIKILSVDKKSRTLKLLKY
jgi:hypothetical protein